MITIGMDYYPEQWDESMWQEDVRRMAALGVKVVRIGEFAWSELEPQEGDYRFEWLDKIIAMIADAGMKVILGTPTNCAPLWLYKRYPQTMQCERDGRRTWTGIRGHRCMTSHVFRKYAGEIIRRMAKRYSGRKEIFAWQIDNEIESNHCTCPECAESFRRFLQDKYHSIDALNRAWGTAVWSGRISQWQEIEPFVTSPNNRPDWYNPAYMLDYERFCSWSTADYVRFQTQIIRESDPDAVVTTNSCFSMNFQNFHEQFRDLDVASYDNYPAAVVPEDPEEFYSNAFVLDLVRSFKKKNFWIMEELGGPMGCWGPIKPAMEPGMLEGYALQAVAHGADLLSFFRWRTAVSGAEMFCYGILDHDGRDSRYLHELEHLAGRLEKLDGLEKTTVRSRAAILYSSDQEYAFRTQMQSEGFSYWEHLRLFHEACVNLGVNTDIVTDKDSLEGYSVLMVPAYAVTDPDFAARVTEFVRQGGTAVFTDRTGVKDIHGNCICGKPLPAYFENLCGINVRETDAIGRGKNSIVIGEDEYPVSVWCDLIEPESAQVQGRYGKKFYKGTAAVTENIFGKGTAWYIGAVGNRRMYRDLMEDIFKRNNIHVLKDLPQGVESVERSGASESYRFFFNNTMRQQLFSCEGREYTMRPLEVIIEREGGER